MADCLFCAIVAGQRKAHVVYENAHVLVFLDIHPASRGHLLVIPKTHAETLQSLPERDTGPLFQGVKTAMGLLEASLRPAGMNIGWNHGWAAGQRVDHLHIHLIPRYPGDGGGGIQSLTHSFVTEELASVAAQIKAAQ
ncbi:MAG TPA: HIT family protein [Candidatus Baltobacteraceae bacterium]|nr:HIT family protein [Candidatus Baltobacteraceae bacterium]